MTAIIVTAIICITLAYMSSISLLEHRKKTKAEIQALKILANKVDSEEYGSEIRDILEIIKEL